MNSHRRLCLLFAQSKSLMDMTSLLNIYNYGVIENTATTIATIHFIYDPLIILLFPPIFDKLCTLWQSELAAIGRSRWVLLFVFGHFSPATNPNGAVNHLISISDRTGSPFLPLWVLFARLVML